MVYVAMSPNDSSNDHSRMRIDDKEEEHQEEEIAEESDSDAMVTKVFGKVPGKYLTKIAELQKS
jgi:ribosomal protein L12E/L44/L45/RPP1/RPP2